MKRTPKRIKNVLDFNGVSFTLNAGKHVKFRVEVDGQNRTIVCPASESDHRGMQNAYADTRRVLRQLGVDFKECKQFIRD